MKKLLRSFRYGELGFTLIELLVVIAILAALAGVVTLAVTRFIGKGEREACLTDQHNVQTALSAWRASNRAATACPTLEELVEDGFLLQAPERDCDINEQDIETGGFECVATCGCAEE